MKKLVNDLRQVCGFLRVVITLISSTNETERHDITEILLKVAPNTIKQAQLCYFSANHDILIQNHDILIHLWFYEMEITVFVLVCFARMHFSEQYCIKWEAIDVRDDEISISSETL